MFYKNQWIFAINYLKLGSEVKMSYELMFQKAVQLQQDGALNEAEQLYRQILETAPDNANVLNMLGLIAQSRGMHQEAAAYFYRAAEKAPQHFPIFFNLAISLGALNRHLEAIEALQKVIKLKPDLPEAHYSLGNIYWQQNRISEAKAAFQKALEINPDYLSARTNLAEINDDVATLEQISADNPDALYYLGRRAWNDKDFAKAVQYLAKADKLTTSAEIKALLAEALEAEGQAETALPIWKRLRTITVRLKHIIKRRLLRIRKICRRIPILPICYVPKNARLRRWKSIARRY